MKRFAFIILFVLTGCAGGSTPELNQYLLRPDPSDSFGPQGKPSTVALGTLRIAPYLDKPGIVTEKADGTIQSAKYHQWAEPLRDSMRTFLAYEISTHSGQPVRGRTVGEMNWKKTLTRNIDIAVTELHGTADGKAHLVAYWAVIDPQESTVLSEHEFSGSEPLASDGFAALVDAEKRLLSELAAAIAKTL